MVEDDEHKASESSSSYVPFADMPNGTSPNQRVSPPNVPPQVENQKKKKSKRRNREEAHSWCSNASSTASINTLANRDCRSSEEVSDGESQDHVVSNRIVAVRVQSARQHSRKSNDETVNFTVYSLCVSTSHNPSFSVFRRYSQFYAFHQQMKQTYPALPTLPPKALFGNKSKGFIKRRVLSLDKYLTALLTTQGISGDLAVMSFLGASSMVTRKLSSPSAGKTGLTEFSWSHRSGVNHGVKPPIYDATRGRDRSVGDDDATPRCFSLSIFSK